MPDATDPAYTRTAAGKTRTPDQARRMWEQARRARWRAAYLVVKAKLEAVATGITTVEDEWLAWTVLPGGRTVADEIHPRIDDAYRTGQVGALLPLGPAQPAIGTGDR